jgi:maltooligosyltrehalose trehalohydrolase
LAEATGRGRVEEFASHGWDVSQLTDPQDPAVFRSAKLDWREPNEPDHARMLALYRALLRLRRTEPQLATPRLDEVRVDFDEQARWLVVHRGSLRVLANLADSVCSIPIGGTELLLATGDAAVVLGADQTVLPAQSAAIIRTR